MTRYASVQCTSQIELPWSGVITLSVIGLCRLMPHAINAEFGLPLVQILNLDYLLAREVV